MEQGAELRIALFDGDGPKIWGKVLSQELLWLTAAAKKKYEAQSADLKIVLIGCRRRLPSIDQWWQ